MQNGCSTAGTRAEAAHAADHGCAHKPAAGFRQGGHKNQTFIEAYSSLYACKYIPYAWTLFTHRDIQLILQIPEKGNVLILSSKSHLVFEGHQHDCACGVG